MHGYLTNYQFLTDIRSLESWVSKNNSHNSGASSKGVQKSILKAGNLNKYKLYHKSFDNNLQKNCRTNILQSDAAQILLIVVLMAGLF